MMTNFGFGPFIIVLCTQTNIVKQMIENLHARVQVGWKILLALRKKYMHLCKCACVKSSSLLGNIFIHKAPRSRLSPQMAELCKEQIDFHHMHDTL